MPDACELLQKLYDAYTNLHPLPDDERVYNYEIDTINAGQVLTETWTVDSGFRLFLQEVWIDTPVNSAFEIYIKGQKFTIDNTIDLKDKPIILNPGETVIYKIFNNDSSQHTYESRVAGFGRRIG